MGRFELVQQIAAQNPHLVVGDVANIVDAVIEVVGGQGVEADAEGALTDAKNGVGKVVDPSDEDARALRRLEAILAQEPDLLERSIDHIDQTLVRDIFELMFRSVERSAATLGDIVQENGRFQREFDERSRDINALQRDIDAGLQRLVAG